MLISRLISVGKRVKSCRGEYEADGVLCRLLVPVDVWLCVELCV